MAGLTISDLLKRKGPVEVIGCHSPLSGKIAESVGFQALWLSSLELSALNGVPDANFLTMSENLDMVRNVCQAVSIPVIADCDSGYGNELNVYRMVQLYEQAGVSGICLEDNVYPKKCSFYETSADEVVTPEEHARRIAAAVQARHNGLFIIARTEAFIRNLGLKEALHRASVYEKAGADAILVHSKKKTDEDLVEFVKAWNGKVPLVCVPTTYNQYSSSELFERGYKIIIFANHGLRASINAMKEAFALIKEKHRTKDLDDQIASLQDVFELTDVDAMQQLIASFNRSHDVR
ncbi:MAG: isocitrate lyase/PEP mutase family protein [Candidatus Peribacteraceae bacterium]|nr:isocitrate lyase/PEP mutase family protein [Candidatus Peribacteraceae bacterium]